MKIGDKLIFQSGNFKGLTGVVINIDNNSNNERAIFGYYHTAALSNGKIGYIEKSEHWKKITTFDFSKMDYSNMVSILKLNHVNYKEIENKSSEYNDALYTTIQILNSSLEYHFDENGGSQLFCESCQKPVFIPVPQSIIDLPTPY